jgi:hypothetical protein
MALQQFIDSYRISTAGSYYERLEEAQLFVSDATEKVDAPMSKIISHAAALYDVEESDI